MAVRCVDRSGMGKPRSGGTYTLEELTDTLMGGKFKGQIVLP